ncbi:MAG TPA: STAS domain-containing protein [Acidimicrobiia bacterium]|nr:STAS domain-containing protein [Acidimicrobiia bacterium]
MEIRVWLTRGVVIRPGIYYWPARRAPRKKGFILEPATSFSVRAERGGSDAMLTLTGDLDINGAPELKKTFDSLDGFEGRVIIDLRSVTFMDSMGLGSLIDGRNRLESDGAMVVLVAGEGPAGRLLALTKLDQSFPMFDSIEAARAST